MNPPAKLPVLTDAIAARASDIHDKAFADPKVEEKPSWFDSVRQAMAEAPRESSAPVAEPEPA